MSSWDNLYWLLSKMYTYILIIMAILLLISLIRAIIGPRISDRIVASNMMGTITMVIIAILSLKLKEGYLLDVCLLYAMISFLAVIVITQVYMRVYLKEKKGEKTNDNN